MSLRYPPACGVIDTVDRAMQKIYGKFSCGVMGVIETSNSSRWRNWIRSRIKILEIRNTAHCKKLIEAMTQIGMRSHCKR
jgi:hypothetical protein